MHDEPPAIPFTTADYLTLLRPRSRRALDRRDVAVGIRPEAPDNWGADETGDIRGPGCGYEGQFWRISGSAIYFQRGTGDAYLADDLADLVRFILAQHKTVRVRLPRWLANV